MFTKLFSLTYRTSMLQFLLYVAFVIFIIYTGHQVIDYFKNAYVPKVTKNIYRTQVEKYQDLVKEIQQEYSNIENNKDEKIEMEEDLINFIDQHI